MSETKKMIEIINQNRNIQYEINKQISAQKKARIEKISNVIAFTGYLVATYFFAQILTMLAK